MMHITDLPPLVPLRLLVYTARYRGDDLNTDLQAILAVSRRNNQRDGVTGCLLVDGQVFVQALEGPPEAIEALYARICADHRCESPEVLLDQPARTRSTWGWSLVVGRVGPGMQETELRSFRDAYLAGFKADAAGFMELLHQMLLQVDGLAPRAGA